MGGAGIDLSSLFSAGGQQSQDSLATTLTAVIQTKHLSEFTDGLRPVIGHKVEYHYPVLLEDGKTVINFSFIYDDAQDNTASMERLEEVEANSTFWQYVTDKIETKLLANTDHDPGKRAERINILQRQHKNLQRLLEEGAYEIYSKYPEILGATDISEFIKKNLNNSFTAEDQITQLKSDANKALTASIMALSEPLEFPFALSRIDDIVSEPAFKKAKLVTGAFATFVAKKMSLGVVKVIIERKTLDEPFPTTYNLRTMNIDSSLSDIMNNFGILVQANLKLHTEGKKVVHGLSTVPTNFS